MAAVGDGRIADNVHPIEDGAQIQLIHHCLLSRQSLRDPHRPHMLVYDHPAQLIMKYHNIITQYDSDFRPFCELPIT